MSGLSNYRRLLLLPGAGAFFGPAVLARLGTAMQGLAILWAVHGSTGSFAVAGLATGAFAVTEAFGAPQVARYVDSHGQRAVAMVQLAAFGSAAVVLIAATLVGAPVAVWSTASALAGVACPQIGSLAAARWRHLTDGSPLMPTALSLEAAVNQLGFMVGPVVVTTLGATLHPVSGLVVATGSVLVGTVLLIRRRESEPPTRSRGPGLILDTRLVTPRLLPFGALHLLLGAYFGGITICLTAAAQAFGVEQYVGAMAAGGGALGLLIGLGYGSVSDRVGATPVMMVAAGALTAACFTLSRSEHVAALVGLTVVAGGCIIPLVVPAGLHLQRVAPAAVYVQAITWTGSASALGTAVSAPLVGRLVDATTPRAGYLALTVVLALLLVAAAGVAGASRRRDVDGC